MKVLIAALIFISLIGKSYAQQDVNLFLIARNTGQKVLANNDTIRIFGFAQSLGAQPGVPGPTLYANEGDSVHIDLWNVSQGAPHTIHLHGLDVDQQNDGVPHLSFEIDHMAHGFYHFKAPHAGTYLYHCHVASTIHVQAGMYGLIIIRPSDGSNTTWNNGYPYDQEQSYFLSEIDTNWHTDSVLMHDHDTTVPVQPISIPKYDPQFFLINGLSDHQLVDSMVQLQTSVDEVNYLRFANIGFYGVRVILPSLLNSKIIDSDGRPLPTVEINDTLLIYPGERYGVLTKASAEFTGDISYEYFNLNTGVVSGAQFVPVIVEGQVGFNELKKENAILFYPNPSVDETNLVIDLQQESTLKIEIYDLNGRLIEAIDNKVYPSGEHTIELDSQHLGNGTYLVRCTLENGQVISKKLIRL